MLVGDQKRWTPVDIVHLCASMCVRVRPLGRELTREAQKLHPVRNAWMAVVHLSVIGI